jgi:hypothetical protein
VACGVLGNTRRPFSSDFKSPFSPFWTAERFYFHEDLRLLGRRKTQTTEVFRAVKALAQ